jgi:hypothetical protein
LVSRAQELPNDFAGLVFHNDRAWRHWNLDIIGALAVPVARTSSPTRTCLEAPIATEVGQRAMLLSQDEHYVAAPPSISTVRAASRNVLFSSEMDNSVASAAGGHEDPCLIYEHLT